MKCQGPYDKDGEFLEFTEGTRVLHGFLYSLRNKKERKYELWDPAFAAAKPNRLGDDRLWLGFPHVYFPVEMLLHAHVKFYLTRARRGSRTRRDARGGTFTNRFNT